MVGVQRSQACITCRKRKKGCDQKRPGCGQCQRLGLECAGYVRQFVFVNTKTPSSCKVRTATLPDNLARSAYQEGHVGAFWAAYLPNGQSLSSDRLQSELWAWSNTIQVLCPTDNTLKKALLALCLAQSDRVGDQKPPLSEEGLKLYGSALREMNYALKRPSKTNGSSILATSKLCGLYETLYGSGDTAESTQASRCIVHLKGELAILISKGPDQYTDGDAHRLFIHGRLGLISSAIRARRKSILSQPEWKTIPWSHCVKSEKDKLLDILVEMPTLIEESDRAIACSDRTLKETTRRQLLDKCAYYDMQLSDWYAGLKFQTEIKPFDGEQYVGTSSPDLASAHLMTLYWATNIILYRIMSDVIGPRNLAPYRASIKAYCQKITRTSPIFFQPTMGTFGPDLALFPMSVVMTNLDVFEPEEKAVEEALLANNLKMPEGLAIGQFLNSLVPGRSNHDMRWK